MNLSQHFASELWKQAGLPAGIWTVVNGDKDAVNELLEHPAVKAISFVGSTLVAQYIYETGAKYGKRVTTKTIWSLCQMLTLSK